MNITNDDPMNEEKNTDISNLLNEANNPLPQIGIPARKKLQAAIEEGETVFVDPAIFGYVGSMK
jgi:hypothetical protein